MFLKDFENKVKFSADFPVFFSSFFRVLGTTGYNKSLKSMLIKIHFNHAACVFRTILKSHILIICEA